MRETQKDRTHALWEEVELKRFEKLEDNLSADVCIIGGGIAGLSTAYQLSKRGFKVVLLEAFSLASGQSGRTTAHLSYHLEDELAHLTNHLSLEKISLLAHAHRRAIDVIEEVIDQENISCDFRRLTGYLFLGAEDDAKILHQEVELGRQCGLNLKFEEEIPKLPNLGPAVSYPGQGSFHPLKYMAGLLHAMEGSETRIFENSPAKDFHVEPDRVVTTLDSAVKVTSQYLVVATDSPVNNRFYIHTKQAAYRTYVVAFKLPESTEVPLLWDTSDPYHYIRQSGQTLIVGGEDHRTGQDPEDDPYVSIKDWARARFPFLGDVQWQWSGQIYEPVDQIAFIGRNPGVEKNVFVVTGQSGLGMTHSTLASLIIPDLIENKPNPWAELFDPSRVSVKGVGEFLKENANTTFQYKDWITPSEVSDLSQIPDDHGCLMREGLTKSCIYHAEGEVFEKKVAVCTHLGGIVHWNDFEKTWDCPCHGSRFNAHGKVIEGPALGDLSER